MIARIHAAFSPPLVTSEPRISNMGKNHMKKQPASTSKPRPAVNTGVAISITTAMMANVNSAESSFIAGVNLLLILLQQVASIKD